MPNYFSHPLLLWKLLIQKVSCCVEKPCEIVCVVINADVDDGNERDFEMHVSYSRFYTWNLFLAINAFGIDLQILGCWCIYLVNCLYNRLIHCVYHIITRDFILCSLSERTAKLSKIISLLVRGTLYTTYIT